MATVLLAVIYLDFIGLGIPDSLLGAAWPAIGPDLGLPVSSGSLVTMTVAGGTIVSSLFSARVIRRLGTGGVTVLSTALTAAALAGFSLAGGLGWLCLCAVPLGLGAGAIDTALNHYVAVHYRAAHINFLHCFYGLGVTLSPLVLSVTLAAGSWRSGYRRMALGQAGLAAVTLLSLPLWRALTCREPTGTPAQSAAPAGPLALLRRPAVRRMTLAFVGSCGIEYTCGNWGATFLVQSRGLAVDTAAAFTMLYYLGMALGRFAAGLLAARLGAQRLVRLGQGVTLAALALLWLPGALPAGAALFWVGVGNGPVFPNLLQQTPGRFGAGDSQAVIGVCMAASYAGILLVPAAFGALAGVVGAGCLPAYLLVWYAVMRAGGLR